MKYFFQQYDDEDLAERGREDGRTIAQIEGSQLPPPGASAFLIIAFPALLTGALAYALWEWIHPAAALTVILLQISYEAYHIKRYLGAMVRLTVLELKQDERSVTLNSE